MKDYLSLLFCCTILVSTPSLVLAQTDATAFLLDSSKDYVYLEFERLGPRHQLSGNEVNLGLWLRLVNNCRIPLIVATFDAGPGGPGTGVYDEVVPTVTKGPTLRLGKRANERLPLSGTSRTKVPQGYSLPDAFSTTHIFPGESILFSVPANHVGLSWSLQVRLFLGLPGAAYGSGPYTVVTFDWVDIPERLRTIEMQAPK